MPKSRMPKFRQALRMMRSRDPQTAEDGFASLERTAAEHVRELIAELDEEQDSAVYDWLIGLIVSTDADGAYAFLERALDERDGKVWRAAIGYLSFVDSPRARTLLWRARELEMETDLATADYRRQAEAAYARARAKGD